MSYLRLFPKLHLHHSTYIKKYIQKLKIKLLIVNFNNITGSIFCQHLIQILLFVIDDQNPRPILSNIGPFLYRTGCKPNHMGAGLFDQLKKSDPYHQQLR